MGSSPRPDSPCHGNGDTHCCWVAGAVCPFLRRHTDGRRWACGLLLELGNWDAVHTDARYLTVVQPVWIDAGVDDCGDWQGRRPDGRGQGPVVPQCCYAEER